MSQFGYAMGLAVDKDLWMATNGLIWRMANVGPNGEFDACFVPRQAQAINGLDCHEISVHDGRVLFCNTAYSCIAELDERHSFRHVWSPSFISALAPEDRCHLNGMCKEYVTAVCKSDIVAGWRDRRVDSGVVINVRSNETVMTALSMPHSPRWHDDALWVLNSGKGELLCDSGFVAFLPGFLRGLAFVGKYAIVGLSLPRNENFAGLPLDEELKKRDAEPWCGIQIVDTDTGHVVEWLRFTDGVRELFDVAALPGVRRPMAVAPGTPEFTNTRTMPTGNVVALAQAAE